MRADFHASDGVVPVVDHPLRDREKHWRTALSDVKPLRMTPGDAPLQSTLRTADLDGLLVGEIGGLDQIFDRDRSKMPLADPGYYLGMPLDGRALFQQNGRSAVLTPGDFVLLDSTRPYRIVLADGFRTLALLIPRTELRVPARTIAEITAVRLSSRDVAGAMLRALLTPLGARLDGVSPSATRHLNAAVLEMVAATLSDKDSELAGAEHLLVRVQRFIHDHLADPDLTPGTVAAAHHISTRYLHKLFESEGETVAGWIRARRLERCRRDLRTMQLSHSSISAIAARWGLPDAAQFSKNFRRHYGHSPSEYRHLHRTRHQ